MKIKALELVNKFYEEVCKEKYPTLTKRQVIEVCYSPFRYLRIAMAKPYLPKIRFKHLGVFQPHVFSILRYYKRLDEVYLNNQITRYRYEYLKDIFTAFIKRTKLELEEEYRSNIENEFIYKVSERRYNLLINIYTTYISRYENKVPIKEDDLKDYRDKYNRVYNR